MSDISIRKVKSIIRAYFVPILLVAIFVAATVCFKVFFVSKPQKKAEKIKELIEKGENEQAVDLLYGFSYGEFADDGATIKKLCEGKPELKLYTLKQNDTFTFGVYEQDNNKKNGAEPIEWRVLSIDDRELIVQTVKVIEEKPYRDQSQANVEVTWETSALYYYLNNTFYESSFSDKEKALIEDTENGKVFIASNKENYRIDLPKDVSLFEAEPTAYVMNNYKPNKPDGKNVSVWVRGKKEMESAYYQEDSNYKSWTTGRYGTSWEKLNGIRPIMRIKVAPIK